MNGSLIHDFARQTIDVEAALFENFDPGVPIHDASIGLDLQCFAAARSK
jgi:hypothetical protein